MGLDSVELVMALEERFEIEIPDQDAVKLRTPRQVSDYIYGRLSHAANVTCLTQRAFYRTQRGLMKVLGVDRRAVQTHTRIESIVPLRSRRKTWKALASASGVTAWPPLVRSSSVTITVAVAPITVGLVLLGWADASPLVSVAAGVLTLATGLALTIPLRLHLSGHWPTVGGVAEYLAIHYPAAILGQSPQWSRDQVRQLVRATVVDELGIAPDFDDNAEFVRDLGVD